MRDDTSREIPSIQKAAAALLSALALLIAPTINLIKSLHFSKNAVTAEATITAYEPEVIGKAGGRREVKDYYRVSYMDIEKRLQLGSRIVTSKESVAAPESAARFKPGDILTVVYLPESPEKMMVKPEVGLFFAVYHSNSSIALLYLLKLASLLSVLFAIRLLISVFKQSKL